MLDENQKKIAAKIINEGLALSNFDFNPVNENDLTCIDNNVINFSKDTVGTGNHAYEDFFNKASINRINEDKSYFHFKSVAITKQIIDNKLIQVSNLVSNEYNDFAEYSEFLNRIGYYNFLIAKDFDNNNAMWGTSEIDKMRQNLLILCFARNNFNPRFWSEYAKNDTGVCLKFNISNFRNQHRYNFRDVYYDSGYDVEFIKHINYYLISEFNHVLLSSGILKFAQFYKRNKYRYESETRFTFDASHPDFVAALGLNLEENGKRKYIALPILGNSANNPFFDIKLEEIVYGDNVCENDKIELFMKLQSEFSYNIPLKNRKGELFTYSTTMY